MGWKVSKELESQIMAQAVSVNGVPVQTSAPASKKARPRPKKVPVAASFAVAGSVHVLWLPGWIPGALNKKLWKHWSVAGKAQKADKAAVQAAVLLCGIPKAERPRQVELYLTLPAGKRCLDRDSVLKGLLDGLVAAGALMDDSPAWCHFQEPHYLRCLYGAPAGAFVVLSDLP